MSPTRRAVVRGAAWSAPTIALVGNAPAIAASSPCQPVPVIVDWQSAQYTRVNASSGYYVIPLSDGTTIRMNISSTWSNMDPGGVANADGGTADDNLQLSAFNIGGTGQPGLVLHQNNYNYPYTTGQQNVTFTFDRQLSTIDFAVTDVDASQGDYVDAVRFSSNLTATPNTGVEEVSYNGQTWYDPTNYAAVDNSSGANNLNAHGEKISSFTISYSNWDQYWDLNGDGYYPDVDRDQRVFLTDFRLTVPPNNC